MANEDIIFSLGRLAKALSGEGRDSLIRSSLPAIFDRDIGVTNAANIYRQAGFHFSDSNFRELYNEGIFEYQANTQIQQYPRQDTITDDILGTTRYNITANYRAVAEVTVYDKDTGLSAIRYFTLDTDNLDTVDTLENDMLDFYIQQYGSLPEQPISIRVISAQKNKSIR